MALISILFLGLGVLSYQTGWGWYAIVVSSIHVVYGLRLFFRRGGPLFTASGVYALTSAVFLGLPPLWTSLAGVYSIGPQDCLISGISFAALAVTDLISRVGKRRKHMLVAATDEKAEVHERVPCWMLGFSVLLFGIGSAMKATELAFAGSAVYVSVLLSAAATTTAISGRKWLLAALSCVLTLSILMVYLVAHFTGFGRLMIASLGISIMFITSLTFRAGWVKAITILTSGPLLVVAAQIRSTSSITARSLLENPLSGLSSMLAPYFEFDRILRSVGMPGGLREFEFQWGKASVPAVSWLVPRWVWPSKPAQFGLGYLLTRWFRPDLASVGHTFAGGSYLGEVYVNFGFLGLLMAPLVLGIVLRLLDIAVCQLAIGPTRFRMRHCMRLVSASILVGGMADYVWGGTMMVSTRGVPRLAFLIPLAAIELFGRTAIGRRESGVRDRITEPSMRG
jgi:hypothetical protein